MKGKLLTLNKNRDFHRLYSRGKSVVSSILVTYVLKSRNGQTRVGITTSKKIGNAVKRNRARRIIKEAYRNLLPRLPQGYNIVFVARGKTVFVKSQDVLRDMTTQLRKIGLLS